MKSFSGKFVAYRIKTHDEANKVMERSNGLCNLSVSLERNYADLMSRNDEENRRYILDTQPNPASTNDHLYRRLCLIQHQVRTHDKNKVKPNSKNDCVLDIVDFFLYYLQRDIKERRLDERTYNELSWCSDFEVRDLYLREAEKIFNEKLKKQKGFFKNYSQAKLDSQIRVTALFEPKPKAKQGGETQ